MSNSFIPRAYQAPAAPVDVPSVPEAAVPRKSDNVGSSLVKIAQYIVVALAFLTPIAFAPGLPATLGFSKVLLALAGSLLIAVLLSLASLRFKQLKTVMPLPLLIFWLFVVAAFVSAFLSGDVQDAIRGSFLEPQTAGFIAILGLVMTVPLVLQRSKIMSLYTLIAFAVGMGLLFAYNLIRFIFGPILAFNSFGQVTSSPIGGLNDLAVLASVALVVGLITVLQLPLKNWMRWAVLGLVFSGLLVLMVANFFNLWIIVGFFALLFLIYILSRDTLFGSDETESESVSPALIVMTLLVCVVSVFFVVAGDYAGAKVSAVSGVSYLEVRPSMSASLDMIKSVYQEDILLGSGPNRFSDMWRMHKDRSINETTFWNVDFNAGFGLVPTLFATLGLLGGVILFAFHLSYLYLGYRALLKSENTDSYWYYFGTVSFAAAIMLWAITYIYVPGAGILLLAALFTGLSFVAYQALVPRATITLQLANNRSRGLFLMGIAVALVVAAVMLMFTVGKQYSAQAGFTKAGVTATSIEEFESGVQEAYVLYPDERFLNTLNQLKISQLRELLAVTEPTEEDQARFASLAQQAIALAGESIARDGSAPDAYIALSDIYNILDRAGLEGARERTLESLAAAEARDPLDPSYNFGRAFVAAQNADYEAAKQYITAATSLKSNYTEALFLLAQIAIQEGDVESAIATTRQVVTFEPNNPTRYYQLGILYAANEQLNEAVAAYQAALTIDPSYANARYMLGLAYTAQGNSGAALGEFRTVLENNQENQELRAIISELESTGTLANLQLGLETPVSENNPSENTEDGVVASSTPDTNLISPVNTEPTPNNSTIETEAPQTE